MGQANPVENLSFETALEELETIVRSLESGQAPLEDSIKAYERGTLLKDHCAKKLREAQKKKEKIAVAKDGSITTQPLDPEE